MGQALCAGEGAVDQGTLAALEEQCIYVENPSHGQILWISDSGQTRMPVTKITRNGLNIKMFYERPDGLQVPR